MWVPPAADSHAQPIISSRTSPVTCLQQDYLLPQNPLHVEQLLQV